MAKYEFDDELTRDDVEDRLDTLEAEDSLAVTYPLSIDDVTNPGVADIKAWTMPHLEYTTVGISGGVHTDAAEALLQTTGWQTVGNPQEINEDDWVRITAWGTWLNNDGTGRQTDFRLRIGGLTGGVALAHRVPTSITAGAVSRFWRLEIEGMIVLDGSDLKLSSTSLFTLSAPSAVGLIDVYSNTRATLSPAVVFTSDMEWVLTADHDTSSVNLNATMTRIMFVHTQARP